MGRRSLRRMLVSLVLGLVAGAVSLPAQGRAPRLRVEQVLADSSAFDVVATLVIGPRHVLLWDAQYHRADAERVAAAIAASGRTLQAIVLSHPDEDHQSGVATILERFPGTPVYLSAAGLRVFDSTGPARFQADRSRSPELFADSLPRPTALPATRLSLDGVTLELLPDLQGDIRLPTNTALWIPESRTLLAGDIVFRGVYPWLGSSDSASRAAWRASLRRLAALKPAVVVAGHKPSADLADTPDVLEEMDRYLADFDSLLAVASSARELAEAMRARYPVYKVRMLLMASAGMAFRGRSPAVAAGGTAPAPAAGGTSQLLPTGTWTGTVSGPMGTLKAEFVVGKGDGGPTLELRPEGPPPVQAGDVRFDGRALSFWFDAGPQRLNCLLTGSTAAGFEGSCGPEPGSAGPFQLKMLPPAAGAGS